MVQNSLLPRSNQVKPTYSQPNFFSPTLGGLANSNGTGDFTTLSVNPNSTTSFNITPNFSIFTGSSPNVESWRIETPSGGNPSNGGVFRGRVARGTYPTPSGSVISGDVAVYLDGFAYASDTASYVRLGSVQVVANETIQNLTRGSRITFNTVPNGASGTVESLRIAGNDTTIMPNTGKLQFNNGGVRIGQNTGNTGQGTNAIAIGSSAGTTNQGNYAIAIGDSAGTTGQGANAIAIGQNAGITNQHSNSIVINASGTATNTDGASRCFIRPLRGEALGIGVGRVVYDPATFELKYSTT